MHTCEETMTNKTVVAAAIAGAVAAAMLFGLSKFWPLDPLEAKVRTLEAEVSSQRKDLLGYTRYTDYLYAGKKQLQEQMKFIAATVVRKEGYTRVVNKSILGVNFNSIVAISYTSEYAFGYALKPGDYDIGTTATGIQITIRKPILVAKPATSNLSHQILSGSVFTNSQAAIIGLYEGLDARTLASGRALAMDEAVIALCEKKLAAFLQDFLAKQPGVKHIPSISIVYKP